MSRALAPNLEELKLLDLLRSAARLVFESHPNGRYVLKLEGSALVVIIAIGAGFLLLA